MEILQAVLQLAGAGAAAAAVRYARSVLREIRGPQRAASAALLKELERLKVQIQELRRDVDVLAAVVGLRKTEGTLTAAGQLELADQVDQRSAGNAAHDPTHTRRRNGDE